MFLPRLRGAINEICSYHVCVVPLISGEASGPNRDWNLYECCSDPPLLHHCAPSTRYAFKSSTPSASLSMTNIINKKNDSGGDHILLLLLPKCI